MATYSGNYQTDLGKVYQCVGLTVYRVEDGLRVATNEDEDLAYLPPIFLQSVTTNRPVCSLPGRTRTMRAGIVILGEELRWVIPCPFMGGTVDFMTFARQLTSRFDLVEWQGERVDPFLVSLYARA
jgi:hypothetical protein